MNPVNCKHWRARGKDGGECALCPAREDAKSGGPYYRPGLVVCNARCKVREPKPQWVRPALPVAGDDEIAAMFQADRRRGPCCSPPPKSSFD